MSEYGDVQIPLHDGALDFGTPACEPAGAYAAIPATGRAFTIATGDAYFTGKRTWRYSTSHSPGKNRGANHLQGVQRAGSHLLLSAGDMDEPAAHLMIASVERDAAGAATGGRIERILALDTAKAHAGAIHRLGDVLAVPLEGGRGSEVRFYCVRDPLEPRALGDASTIRRRHDKASAAALSRLPDGRVIAGVAYENDLDLYLSTDEDIRHGFHPAGGLAHAATLRLGGVAAKNPKYQAIAFFPAVRAGDGGVIIAMVAFRNTRQSLSNWYAGQDLTDYLELHVPAARLADWSAGAAIGCGRPETKEYLTGRCDGNFCAASGLDVREDGSAGVLALHHWRTEAGFRATEYHS